MITLKLKEHLLFEEHAGKRWSAAQSEFAWKFCQMHRLQVGACTDCLATNRPFCEAHQAVSTACQDCEKFSPDTKVLAVTAWISKRRSEPGLTWDDYIARADEADGVSDIAAAVKAEGEETPA